MRIIISLHVITLLVIAAAARLAAGEDETTQVELRTALIAAGRRVDDVRPWPELPIVGARAFRSGDGVYFVLPTTPAGGRLRFPRLNNVVQAAVRLNLKEGDSRSPALPRAYRQADLFPFSQTPTEWAIAVPAVAGPLVVALDLVGEPVLSPEPFVVRPASDGTIVLPAHHSIVHGEKLQFEPLPHKNTVGYWVNPSDWVEWLFTSATSGEYEIHLLQGCGTGQGGSRLRITLDHASLDFTTVETGHFQNFRWRNLGRVSLADGGQKRLQLRVQHRAHDAVMDVRQIRLVPITPAVAPKTRIVAARDVSTVVPDLIVPPLNDGPPSAGRRVFQTTPGYESTAVYHTLALPTDWRPMRTFPVIVEFTGNGPYRNRFGDVSTGRVEDARLGYGLAGNDGWIWLSLPYLNDRGTANVTQWWGDAPDYRPQPTLEYCRRTIDYVCKEYGGDRGRIILVGFSRGAIACSYLGLHDDQIAPLWRGFICFSHFDGVREDWPYRDGDRISALARLQRLKDRPVFILNEESDAAGSSLSAVRQFLTFSGTKAELTFASTGFRNHSDAWALCPSPARAAVRAWLAKLVD